MLYVFVRIFGLDRAETTIYFKSVEATNRNVPVKIFNGKTKDYERLRPNINCITMICSHGKVLAASLSINALYVDALLSWALLVRFSLHGEGDKRNLTRKETMVVIDSSIVNIFFSIDDNHQ